MGKAVVICDCTSSQAMGGDERVSHSRVSGKKIRGPTTLDVYIGQ